MSPARPPLPLAEALGNVAAWLDNGYGQSAEVVREAAAVLDALVDALESARPFLGMDAVGSVGKQASAALARAWQAVP